MNEVNEEHSWTYVQGSTNIAAITFLSETPLADFGTLRIRFISGAEYSYDKVPNQLAVDFFESESKGKFFWANISNAYEGVRSVSNELQDELEDRLSEDLPAEYVKSVAAKSEEPPLPEDIPISELFDDKQAEEPVLPTPYRPRT